MLKIKNDVTNEYYDMLNSFRADNKLKVDEVLEDLYPYNFSMFDKEKELIKNKDERLMKDIELLEKLEFRLRHEYLKIIEIDRESLED